MAKDKKEVAAEVGLPETAVESKGTGKNKGKTFEQAPVNELVFRKGDELELSGLPFKVKEVRGVDLTLARMDIK